MIKNLFIFLMTFCLATTVCADTELDNMEYANDGDAQTAYVSSDTGYDSNTKLLIHFDGSDGDQSDYTAETGQTVTTVGTAQLDTAQKVFGTASLLLDGNSDYITIPDSADWNFGSGDFTIDFRVRFTGTWNDYAPLYEHRTDSNNRLHIGGLAGGDLGKVRVLVLEGGSTELSLLSSITLSTDTQHHIAVVRNGDTVKLYIDGTERATGDFTTGYSIPDFTSDIYVGFDASTRYHNGWMDEYRISKGIARWTSNFTPPTSEYIANLQSYSESTIKTQGSYSLKAVAAQTDSLNDTLTRTVNPTIDLSGLDDWIFYIYSNRTGSNIKVGIRDSGGTTTETTANITSAGAWQVVEVDISGVSNANKDAIDRIIITPVNADALNTFYVDDMYARTVAVGAGQVILIPMM